MTWNPDSDNKIEQVNINDTIAQRSNAPKGLDNDRSSDASTYGGELVFPEVAPLIFPTLDEVATATGQDPMKMSGFAKGYTFVANHWDERATAQFASKKPDSVLSQVPQGEFTSRYADPNSAAASGSLISFVSGKKLIPGPYSRGLIGGLMSVAGQAVRGEKQGSEWEKCDAQQ